jgi:NAD(P)-dependent dehydrogenase (short-subunit alcohol dehydrogenase family)
VPAERGAVIVTGGASGLGAAVVEVLVADGFAPFILDRVPPGNDIPHRIVDLVETDRAADAVEAAARRDGGLAAVVTCAGTDACGRLDEVPAAEWERVVRVNLFGTAAVVRAALPHLERTRGRVVTVASTLGLRGVSDATAYCASKFGVIGFTRALAAETAGRIGVTLLIPGGMRTAFFDGRPEQYRPAPEAELARPEDVAQAVLFALRQPAGCEVRELLVATPRETSWP